MNDNEGAGIRCFDDLFQRCQLPFIDDHIQHVILLFREMTMTVDDSCATSERLRQNRRDFFLAMANDRDRFADSKSFADEINQIRTDDNNN
jgi:hypothetical protein